MSLLALCITPFYSFLCVCQNIFCSPVGMYHKPYDQLRSEGSVPGIPVQPVSYGDIVHFMAQLSDHTPPPSWTGGLNLTYRIAQSVDNNK